MFPSLLALLDYRSFMGLLAALKLLHLRDKTDLDMCEEVRKCSSFRLPTLSHCQAMSHFQDCPSTPVGTCKRHLQGERRGGISTRPSRRKQWAQPCLPSHIPVPPGRAALRAAAGSVADNGFCRYCSTASLNFCRITSEIVQSLLPNSGHPLKTHSV